MRIFGADQPGSALRLYCKMSIKSTFAPVFSVNLGMEMPDNKIRASLREDRGNAVKNRRIPDVTGAEGRL